MAVRWPAGGPATAARAEQARISGLRVEIPTVTQQGGPDVICILSCCPVGGPGSVDVAAPSLRLFVMVAERVVNQRISIQSSYGID